MKTELTQRELIQAMRRKNHKLERDGEYWTEEDKEKLYGMFEQGCGISEIAIALQRTEQAVIQQIEKMNLYNRSKYIPKNKCKSICICLCKDCTLGPKDSPNCKYACHTKEDKPNVQ